MVAIGAIGMSGCGLWDAATRAPQLTLRCAPQEDGTLRFELQTVGINTISVLFMWSEATGEPLWGFFDGGGIKPQDLRTFTYGVLPQEVRGHSSSWIIKVFPGNKTPRPILTGEDFIVYVDYQYDRVGPCVGYSSYRFGAASDSFGTRTGRLDKNVLAPPAVSKAIAEVMSNEFDRGLLPEK
jgi:hypothetical protein